MMAVMTFTKSAFCASANLPNTPQIQAQMASSQINGLGEFDAPLTEDAHGRLLRVRGYTSSSSTEQRKASYLMA
jgi:hypothetical protein